MQYINRNKAINSKIKNITDIITRAVANAPKTRKNIKVAPTEITVPMIDTSKNKLCVHKQLQHDKLRIAIILTYIIKQL